MYNAAVSHVSYDINNSNNNNNELILCQNVVVCVTTIRNVSSWKVQPKGFCLTTFWS
jgi:hypothetical protein